MSLFIRTISAESLKLKRTLALAMTVLAPLLIGIAIMAAFLQHAEYYIQPEGINPWNRFVQNMLIYWTMLMMPLFVTLESALLGGLEHTQKNWKMLYALAVPRRIYYIAKQIIAMGLIALSTLFMIIIIVLAGKLLQVIIPRFGFNAPIPWLLLFKYAGLSYLVSWLIIAIHTWISIRWKSFVIACGAGIAATVGALFIFGTDWVYYYPWTMPGIIVMEMNDGLRQWIIVATSIVLGMIIPFLASADIDRKDVL